MENIHNSKFIITDSAKIVAMQISELGMILTAFHLGGWNFYTPVVKTGFVQNTTQKRHLSSDKAVLVFHWHHVIHERIQVGWCGNKSTESLNCDKYEGVTSSFTPWPILSPAEIAPLSSATQAT
jgi:hypothetical protein